MIFKRVIIILFIALVCGTVQAQQLAVKSDVAWDALMVPNLGADVVVGNRTTLGLNVFATNKIWNNDIKAFAVQPEYRYYFSGRAMHQHYIGLGGLGLAYSQKKEDRKTDCYAGGLGLLFGYVLHFGNRWNVDFHAGCGVYLFHKKKSLIEPKKSDWSEETSKGMLAAPTSFGVSINYVIK